MTGQRAEGLVQVLIMLAIGAMAGAASFTHVHDVTIAHGQPNWIGWANAVVVELMSIALGLELRRRARTRRPTSFVATALLFFVTVSLAAQVVEAERSIIGWLAAALPAIGFLVLAKVVLSRTAAVSTTASATDTVTPAPADPNVMTPAPATELSVPTLPTEATDDNQHIPAVELVDELADTNVTDLVDDVRDDSAVSDATTFESTAPTSDQSSPATAEFPSYLLPTARFSIVQHEQTTGRPITKTELATRMSIDPDVAGQLLHALTDPPTPINGTPVGGPR